MIKHKREVWKKYGKNAKENHSRNAEEQEHSGEAEEILESVRQETWVDKMIGGVCMMDNLGSVAKKLPNISFKRRRR